MIERDSRLSVENIHPTMLLIPSMSYNQDHEALFRACMTAARPGLRTERHFIPLVLGYDNTSLFWARRPNGSTPPSTSTSAISWPSNSMPCAPMPPRSGARSSMEAPRAWSCSAGCGPGSVRRGGRGLCRPPGGVLMVIVSVHQPNFMPWLKLLAKVLASDVYVAYDSVQFTRQEFHARQLLKSRPETRNGSRCRCSAPALGRS
ncbi:conserved hypothetical protein [Arthrobacter sp. Hiyo8]|nr:conserved hypothetical protein [Arthrobacter sp. Hiyo8]